MIQKFSNSFDYIVFVDFRYEEVIKNCTLFLNLLEDFTSLGSAMRTVMTNVLTESEIYQV